MADTPADTRDDQTIVAVALKGQIEDGAVKEGIFPGRVTLGWLRLPKNRDTWVEVDPDTGRVGSGSGDAAAGSIAEVLARVEAGEVTAAQALAAEQAKDDKARSTLVDQLTTLANAGQEG